QLIAGREDTYFGYEFDIQAGEKKLPANVVAYYVGLVSNREALRGSLAFYREWFTMVGQNAERAKTPLPMPVLAIGGAQSWGDAVGGAFTPLGNDVQGAVIAGAGHWIAEQDPAGTLAALKPF